MTDKTIRDEYRTDNELWSSNGGHFIPEAKRIRRWQDRLYTAWYWLGVPVLFFICAIAIYLLPWREIR